MRIKLIIEYASDSTPLAQHLLMLPNVTDNNFYREVSSFNAFFFNDKWPIKTTLQNTWFAIKEFSSQLEMCEFHHTHPKMSQHRHTSIFEFYKFIKYDYKKKRFT